MVENGREMARMRHLALALAIVGTAACDPDGPSETNLASSASSSETSSGSTVATPPDAVPEMYTVVVTPHTEYGDALIHGTVVVDDGCINLQLLNDSAGTGDASRAVLWPAGTTWDPSLPGIVFPDGASVRIGGEIHAAGGFHSANVVRRDYLAGAGQLGGLQACVDDDTIVVLNPLYIEIVDT